MANVTEGDRVRIAQREQTEEDIKSGLYYAHLGGMTGHVLKVYSPTEISVDVEHDSLTKEIRQRHQDVRNQMKTKWLDGLSEEGRNRLTEREKDFHLRYVVLVGESDLEKIEERADSTDALRRTSADLDAAEAAELARRKNG